MAEINKIPNQSLPIGEQPTPKTAEDAEKRLAQISNGSENSIGRGSVGQPLGLPAQTPVTQTDLMSDVVTGRDLSQLVAAEHLRANGGTSATDALLGLNQQPSMLGGLLAPPGNLEALRHLTPSMRRNILRTLLAKQREQMRRLVAVVRDEEQQQHQDDENESEESNRSANLAPATANYWGELAFHNQRVVQDLASTTKMLDLLDELLNMQDYTLSQIGTFAQG